MALDDHNRTTPFYLGVSGHRDLRPEDLEDIRRPVADFLRLLKGHLPDTELRVVAGMAAGADILVAEVALELGIGVEAVLPKPLAAYAADFDPETLRVLEALLRSPLVRCIELSGQTPAVPGVEADASAQRDAPYLNLTREIGRTCNLLLAVWDGSPSVLTGGTADTVLRYLGMRTERNSHEVSVVLTDAPADQQPPFRLVYWVPAARVSQSPPRGEQPCFLSGLGDNVLQRWRGMPKQLASQLDELNAYNREYRQVARDARKRRAPDSLARTLPKDSPVSDATRTMLARIDAEYGKADALAMYYQRRSDRLFTFFSLMAFVMGLAYLAYERFIQVRMLLYVYLLVLFSSLGLYYLLHGRRWFAKHLMCRALAETLRAKFYLHFAGADRLVDAEAVISLSGIDRFHGFSWIGHVLTSIEGPPQSAAERGGTQDCCVDDVDTAWIESQRKYFVSKVARLERASRRTKHLQQSLFVVIMLVVVSLIALGDAAERVRFGFGISLENVLLFVMGVVAVVLGIWELHQNKMATRELLWQYRNQLDHFSRARSQLSRTSTSVRRREILAELGKDSLMESYLWTIHRYHREHEPPGRA